MENLGALPRFALLAIICAGLLACVALVWMMISGALNNLAVAGPVIAAIVALAVFAAGEFFTRRRIAQQYRWDKITGDYEKFVEVVRRGAELSGPEPPEELVEFFSTFGDRLLLWGSPGVIKAWRVVRQADWDSVEPTEAVLIYARVLVAIRKDLGHTRNLDIRDLLGVTINDIDEHLPPGRRL